MKKVLFATTALVATAGVAAADVTFGGYGRFGILYTDTAAGDTTNITSRLRLIVNATAESDAGVVFGGTIHFESEERDAAAGVAPGFNGARFFARSGGFEVGVGNIYGALEFMPGQYPIDLGLTGHSYDYVAYNFRGDAYQNGQGLGSSGSNGIEVLYSAGDLAVHVSATNPTGPANDRIAGHIAYTWNGWTFALGAQDSDFVGDTDWTVTVGGSFGVADVNLAYAKNGDDNGVIGAGGTGDHWVLSGRFDVGAATNIEAYVADADYFAETSYGVDFNHDMGGGTSLRGGISSTGADATLVDFGVRFNF